MAISIISSSVVVLLLNGVIWVKSGWSSSRILMHLLFMLCLLSLVFLALTNGSWILCVCLASLVRQWAQFAAWSKTAGLAMKLSSMLNITSLMPFWRLNGTLKVTSLMNKVIRISQVTSTLLSLRFLSISRACKERVALSQNLLIQSIQMLIVPSSRLPLVSNAWCRTIPSCFKMRQIRLALPCMRHGSAFHQLRTIL